LAVTFPPNGVGDADAGLAIEGHFKPNGSMMNTQLPFTGCIAVDNWHEVDFKCKLEGERFDTVKEAQRLLKRANRQLLTTMGKQDYYFFESYLTIYCKLDKGGVYYMDQSDGKISFVYAEEVAGKLIATHL
jgi:hypothetical protein